MDEITKKNYEELTTYKDTLYDKYYFNVNVDFTNIDDERARKIEEAFKRIFEYMSCKFIDKELVEKELDFVRTNLERLIKEYG